ncbi:hypothetical protein [Glycomyces paridis]|uniref:Uncharacterized protein n=1 Tax=Glycomyces paridis TaxID=2126555 RepID=A0A4S8PHY1_9ACTN|nr:hypothetical protein [Glycomyces paridis]THV30207.1 hypothetical protein E9998_07500 [Glycomyces paridis]
MIESTRVSVAEVAGPINSSKGQAEHTMAAAAKLGADEASARMKATIDRIEEAESIRATLEGALVKAHWTVLSAIHGTIGPGARGKTSSLVPNSDGTTSWHGTVDGIKTEIVYGTPKDDEKDPSGQELTESTRPRRRFSAFRQIAVREDASDADQTVSQLLDHANTIYRTENKPAPAPATATSGYAAVIQHESGTVQPIPAPQSTADQLASAAIVIAVVGAKAVKGTVDKMTSLRSKMRERKRNDH